MDSISVRHARKCEASCCLITGDAHLDVADMKFVLLHEARNDDGIKSFFHEVWELYVKVSLMFHLAVAGGPRCSPVWARRC